MIAWKPRPACATVSNSACLVIGGCTERLMGDVDKGCGSPGQRSVLAVNQSQFPFKFEIFDGNEAQAAGLDVVLRKAGADYRSPESPGNKLLDQGDAAKFHGDAQPIAKGIEHPFERLPGGSCFGKDQRYLCSFSERNHLFTGQGMAGLNYQLQFVAKHRNYAQRGTFDGERDDTHVHRSQLDFFNDFATEVAI